MHHCPSNCHEHTVQSFAGVASGFFTAPDHEYPSYLELRLTATDSGGLTDATSVQLDPQTVTLTFQTIPGGLELTAERDRSEGDVQPHGDRGIDQHDQCPVPQNKGKKSYNFASWSDGGAQTHTIAAPATATTYTARFR